MELNWSTFFLEIVNFLVLVWILKRFLYQPVLDVIARRRAEIEKTLADAKTTREQAKAIEVQYQNRLSDWEQEKETAHAALREELSEERSRLVLELRRSLEKERERARVLEQRRLSDSMQRLEETALKQGTEFAAGLLLRVASPGLEASLLDLVLDDLSSLSRERLDALREAAVDPSHPISVASAFPLSEKQRTRLDSRFREVLGQTTLSWRFEEDPALMSGLRIGVGPWILRANLKDELDFFAQSAHDAA